MLNAAKFQLTQSIVCTYKVTGSICIFHDLFFCCFFFNQVQFSEPLSFLQRIAEDITYHNILNNAVLCDNTLEEMAHVAAFAVSAYESTAIRIYKPFNPMLGETYELDRRAELGFRLLFEQVRVWKKPHPSLGHVLLLIGQSPSTHVGHAL